MTEKVTHMPGVRSRVPDSPDPDGGPMVVAIALLSAWSLLMFCAGVLLGVSL